MKGPLTPSSLTTVPLADTPGNTTASTLAGDFSPMLTPVVSDGTVDVDDLERIFIGMLSQWRTSVGSLLPSIEIDTELNIVEVVPFRAYLESTADLTEFHVYALEKIGRQCAWILDRRLISYAVDCLFGGTAESSFVDMSRRYTAVDLSVRHQLLSFLVLAFEQSIPSGKSIRLGLVREERRSSHLKIADPDELVVRLRVTIRINQGECPVEFVAPWSAIRYLTLLEAIPPAAPGSSAGQQSFKREEEIVDVTAVLTETEISVAQLSALTLGQIIPIPMEGESVKIYVEGELAMTGQSGSRHGLYAVRIDKASGRS
jgi:flagellar motor switch protein FliM